MTDDKKKNGPIPDTGISRIGTDYGIRLMVASLGILALGFTLIELLR
jgi:hypothetical protein